MDCAVYRRMKTDGGKSIPLPRTNIQDRERSANSTHARNVNQITPQGLPEWLKIPP
jgi:hypothetical protein